MGQKSRKSRTVGDRDSHIKKILPDEKGQLKTKPFCRVWQN